MDDAGAAMAGAAAIFGAGEVRGLAQRPEQRRVGIHPVVDGLAVHGKAAHAQQIAMEGRAWEATGSTSASGMVSLRSSWRAPTGSTRWTRRCSPRSATP